MEDGGRYYIETSPLTCSANQCTGFYMITASVMKVLTELLHLITFFILMFFAFLAKSVCTVSYIY